MTTSTTPPPYYTPACLCPHDGQPGHLHYAGCPRRGGVTPQQRRTAAAHALTAAERTTNVRRAAELRRAANRWLEPLDN